MFRFVIFINLVLGFSYVYGDSPNFLREPPSFLHKCRFSDPDYKQCSRQQVTQVFKQLTTQGIPGLKNVPIVDPFRIDKIRFHQGTNNVVLKVLLKNVVIRGLKNLRVESSYINRKTLVWHTRLYIPKLRLDANYDMDGRILVVPLRGNGELFIELYDIKPSFHIQGKLIEENGYKFLNLTNIKTDISIIGGLKTQLTNLFNGNKELESSTNAFLNENWRDVYDALKPVVQQTIDKILLDICQKLYKSVPITFFIEDI